MTFPPIKRLNQELLDNIANRARSSPRLRQNYNFHELSEKVQRFINVLQPGTYVRPHRHCRAGGLTLPRLRYALRRGILGSTSLLALTGFHQLG